MTPNSPAISITKQNKIKRNRTRGLTRDVISSPAVSDVEFLLPLKQAKVYPASTFLGIRCSQGSCLHPVLRDQGCTDEASTQQGQEERREDRAPSKHRRHPWFTGRASLRIVRDHWTEEKERSSKSYRMHGSHSSHSESDRPMKLQ